MFWISGTEFLIISLVFIIVVGPKKLPKMLRAKQRKKHNMRVQQPKNFVINLMML
ncbi:twin-arginine translocase TatA/TatE family subunit [Bartonella bacilliformis]|uniref:Sec-independent protein translocase subunit TatA/TatB n=1 Tax=Bartonella bacilliformis TaxID=774 RepID=UPI00049F44D1|nr:twin-arginine translocase TatA/TatE family subunit [Bartonella bacilliformis]KEG16610.1 hypothetical protein H705_00480 [Bartonella bacilliformis Cond044]